MIQEDQSQEVVHNCFLELLVRRKSFEESWVVAVVGHKWNGQQVLVGHRLDQLTRLRWLKSVKNAKMSDQSYETRDCGKLGLVVVVHSCQWVYELVEEGCDQVDHMICRVQQFSC